MEKSYLPREATVFHASIFSQALTQLNLITLYVGSQAQLYLLTAQT